MRGVWFMVRVYWRHGRPPTLNEYILWHARECQRRGRP